MAKKATKASKAAKQDAGQGKRPTGPSAKTVGSAQQPTQMCHAEQAFNEFRAGKFDYDLEWHYNCVFDMNRDDHGVNLCVFADGSAIKWDSDGPHGLRSSDVLRYLANALLEAYQFCLRNEQEFVLWIADERFTGTPRVAFKAVLRLLDPPLKPPRRVLGLIEDHTNWLGSQPRRARRVKAVQTVSSPASPAMRRP